MRFSELTPGRRIEAGEYTVSEQEIIEFATRYDPQVFHTDPEKASQGRWGGVIASGWHTCSIAMRLVCERILLDSDAIASPGMDYLKWLAPVRPGDRLRLTVEVLTQRISQSGSTGIVQMRWMLFNQAETMVLDLSGTSLFDLRKYGGV